MSTENTKRLPVSRDIPAAIARTRRHARLRKNIRGTAEPRVVVHRSRAT